MWRYVLTLSLVLTGYAYLIWSRPAPEARVAKTNYAPVKGFEQFALGYRDVMADLLWLNVIQNFDSCEQNPSAPLTLLDDYEESADPLAYVLSAKRGASRCNFGWVYQMIDRITDAAPRYEVAYTTGGTMLSVLVDDRSGATAIFEKGMLQFPHNWSLAYRAAYHALFEAGDGKKAAQFVTRAAENGGPAWLYSLAANIYNKAGQAQLGKSILEDTIRNMAPSPDRDRLQKRLNEIEYALEQASRQPSAKPEKLEQHK